MYRRLTAALLALVSGIATAQFVPSSPPNEGRPPAPYRPGSVPRAPDVGRDLADIRARIDDGRDAGTLSRRDARSYRRDVHQVERLADRYGRDGLSTSERAELDTRATVLRDQVNVQRLRGSGRTR